MYFQLLVYPGRAHWYKPIDELSLLYRAREEAEEAKRMIEKYNSKYLVEIIEVN